MDRLTAFVAIAQLKLRLQYLGRHPELIEEPVMVPKFAGLSQALGLMRHELEAQAESLMADIDATRADAKGAFGQAKAKVAEAKAAVADVKAFVADMEGSNGGPILGGSSTTSDLSAEALAQAESLAKLDTAAAAVAPSAPEQLTVNGVSKAG